ncbi:MAG: DUF2723 domain-containing protein [Chitinispirillaceae bacterium]|nr:DUF2723 domain-containing protein [Chitinispirillaceae bacterium]
MNFFKSHSRTNALVAALVFAISFVVYCLTVSPALCLWDCGEYLAASAGLGIPHPPGTPLLVILGRAWIVAFSFIETIGLRYNMLAATGSAIVVLFVYLIIVRGMIMTIGGPDSIGKRLAMYCGGFVGSLFCAFSATFWFEALEMSGQSNVKNLPVIITFWLALIWAQSKDERRDRILLLIAYISFLCIGIHLMSMIALPAIFLFIIIMDPVKRKDWRLYLAAGALASAFVNLSWFMIACASVIVVSLFMTFVSQPAFRRSWRFNLWFGLLAALGFSVHLYLPIRASLEPMINEGNPVSLSALKEVLDRKQYGDESMVTRSLWRRGALSRQYGIEGHMGYGGFHLLQFFHFDTKDQEKNFVDGSPAGFGKLFVYLIPTFFMLLGMYLMAKKNKKVAAYFIVMTFMLTLAMVWYMNFSDGTRAERHDYEAWVKSGQEGPMPTVYREVRVRDYFYLGGFTFFGMWMGITSGLVLAGLFASKNRNLRTVAAPFALVLLMVSPALPLTQNYKLRDRSENWLPFEYAYNLLMSCAKDGILFTNGDNDTFPVWAIQEAYGVRRDVRLINLSLVNTQWYVKQLKKYQPRVPVSYTESQIDRLQPELNPFEKPVQIELPGAKIRLTVPGREQLQVLRVQDKMVLNVVDANKWSKPVYFACSVSPDNFMGLEPYIQMQGMVYEIKPTMVNQNERVDIERTTYLLDSVYKLRLQPKKLTDRDEPYEGISNDYAISFMWLAMQLQEKMTVNDNEIKSLRAASAGRKRADTAILAAKKTEFDGMFDNCVRQLDRCVSLMPWNNQPIMLRQQILLRFEKAAMAEERARALLAKDPGSTRLRDLLAQALEAQGKRKEVQELLQGMPALPGLGG